MVSCSFVFHLLILCFYSIYRTIRGVFFICNGLFFPFYMHVILCVSRHLNWNKRAILNSYRNKYNLFLFISIRSIPKVKKIKWKAKIHGIRLYYMTHKTTNPIAGVCTYKNQCTITPQPIYDGLLIEWESERDIHTSKKKQFMMKNSSKTARKMKNNENK